MCLTDTIVPSAIDPIRPERTGLDRTAMKTVGTARRRLWQLPAQCHCPVVGVCLTMTALRRLVDKSLGGTALADDYELHVGVVHECRTRNAVSERLQRALDQRHASTIARFRQARTDEAVLALWQQAVHRGDLSGAFWAAVTHPACSAPSLERLFREIHMLQHQAGARVQAGVGEMQSLVHENAVLARELARVQARTTTLLSERTDEIARLRAELERARADAASARHECTRATDALAMMRSRVPKLESRERLVALVADLQARLARQVASPAGARAAAPVPAEPVAASSTDAGDRSVIPSATMLASKTVLCVGGRPSSLPAYRQIVERYGAEYVHHDGGVEENPARLVTSIAAADVVICQTGCISHDAYWRVKDHCRRTGKPCIYVANPSASSLDRNLAKALQRSAPQPFSASA